ncbi:hypothetical protein TURU_009653 [Turdus rufiventris]|nr:hypothetical protein TURU_009653 [Turdus rufiventris]
MVVACAPAASQETGTEMKNLGFGRCPCLRQSLISNVQESGFDLLFVSEELSSWSQFPFAKTMEMFSGTKRDEPPQDHGWKAWGPSTQGDADAAASLWFLLMAQATRGQRNIVGTVSLLATPHQCFELHKALRTKATQVHHQGFAPLMIYT